MFFFATFDQLCFQRFCAVELTSDVLGLKQIPARFSLKLLKNREMVLKLNQMRRLLNTEKLMFKVESLEEVNNKVLPSRIYIAFVNSFEHVLSFWF